MDNKLVIHCVGLEGLTITVSGADHSIPTITDVLRVTTLLGSIEYTIPQLPITYNVADLNGNLIISDKSGKALYRWRLHATAPPPQAEPQQPGTQSAYNHERERHTPSISAPPSYRAAATPPNSRFSRALNELSIRRNASSDAEATAEHPSKPRRLCSGNRRKVTHLEPSLSQSSADSIEDCSTSSSPTRRPKKKIKRKSKAIIEMSEESESEPSESDIPLTRKRKSRMRPKVAIKSESGSNLLESDIASPRKQRPKRRESIRLEGLDDRDSETPVTYITHTGKVFLRHILDRLSDENKEDSEPFAKPVDIVTENVPTYHTVIKRPMDLHTLKENLGKGSYSAVEDFEADFNLIIDNSIRFNGPRHEVSQGGLRLLNAFNKLMASLPNRN